MSFTCNRKPNAISKSDVIKEQVFAHMADEKIYLNRLYFFVLLFRRSNQHTFSDTPSKLSEKMFQFISKFELSVLNSFIFLFLANLTI